MVWHVLAVQRWARLSPLGIFEIVEETGVLQIRAQMGNYKPC